MSYTSTVEVMELVKQFLKDNNCSDIVDLWMEQKSSIEKIQKSSIEKIHKSKKSKSPSKDPNKPKRGRSAYIYFCLENRSEIKESMKGSPKPFEIMKEMGRIWKLLKESIFEDDIEKLNKYTVMANKDKQRNLNEMESYVPIDIELESVKKPTKSISNKPKKGKSSYIFFCCDMRAQIKEKNPNATPQEVTKLLGNLWFQYKTEDEYSFEFNRFTEMSTNDKLRYEKEMIVYDSITEPTQNVKVDIEPDTDSVSGSVKTKIKKTTSSKKNLPYINFCKVRRELVKNDNPDMSSTDITKTLSKEWKNLNLEEKEEFK
jgi:hypothetical protein